MGQAYPVDDDFCNFPCSGDESQLCGGYGYMNIWALDEPRPGKAPKYRNPEDEWNVVNCYKCVLIGLHRH